MIELNDKAPDFTLQSDSGDDYRLSSHMGERVLLVFYPGDNTPICTRQLCEYRDGIESFADLGVSVVGISSDDLESHRAFRNKHDLPFVLLSDPDLEVARLYGCKGALGMKRAVFLVDEKGIVRYAHIEALALFRRRAKELLEAIRGLDEDNES
ncbi:peroxiredoxin [Candidatus Fermentibacteria bacterium]|nr:MAG: peroxiredoxin [Candidatus Fermentibacteria bacterium]